MKRKRKLLLLLAVSLLVLAGWGQKKVELLSDKKLIDLSAAIGNCALGAEDLIPDEGKDTPTPLATPVPVASATPKPTATSAVTPMPTSVPTSMPAPTIHPKPTPPAKPRTYDIRVRDEQVTYKNETWPELDILAEQLQGDHNDWTSFCLIDDYAEAHVYRRMLEILNGLEAEIGLRYTIE